MENSEPGETGQQFMIQLFEQTRGDQSVQVSMYDIGGLLGLERDAACRVAEELIGLQMVEIRTLSGGIGISAAGSEMVQGLIGPLAANLGESAKLGGQPLAVHRRQAITQSAVGKAELEVINHIGMGQAAFDQIGQRFGAVLQTFMIIIDHLFE